jgi:hypothetical protein
LNLKFYPKPAVPELLSKSAHVMDTSLIDPDFFQPTLQVRHLGATMQLKAMICIQGFGKARCVSVRFYIGRLSPAESASAAG